MKRRNEIRKHRAETRKAIRGGVIFEVIKPRTGVDAPFPGMQEGTSGLKSHDLTQMQMRKA